MKLVFPRCAYCDSLDAHKCAVCDQFVCFECSPYVGINRCVHRTFEPIKGDDWNFDGAEEVRSTMRNVREGSSDSSGSK